MTTTTGVRLLEVEPDLARFLSHEERDAAQRIVLPTVRLPRGDFDVAAILTDANAFDGIVLEGMLAHRLAVAGHEGLRLLGPGDAISFTGRARSMLTSRADCRVVANVRLALLGDDLLAAVRRLPGLLPGLRLRLAEDTDRIMTQLVICQLPRVEDRVLAIMWLLAESWGRVTPAGTELPISLTHDLLGRLIGARRPTVTLALSELADRGAMIRQGRGWLLLQRPAMPEPPVGEFEEPELLDYGDPGSPPGSALEDDQALHAQLVDTIARLREQHVRTVEQVRQQLERSARGRAHLARITSALRPPDERRSAPS